jgi:hypothetical protein
MTARTSCFRAMCAAHCCAFDGWSTRLAETRAKLRVLAESAMAWEWVMQCLPRAVSYRAIKDLVTTARDLYLGRATLEYLLCGTVTRINGDMMA